MPWERLGSKTLIHSRGFWVGAVVLLLLIVTGIAVGPRVKRRYERWSASRHVLRAAEYFAGGDYKRALLDARSALQINPRDVEAIRIVAKSLEAGNAPEAIPWRRRLDSIRPGDAENLLAWARDALNAGDAGTAETVAGNLKPADQNSAAFHDLNARIALTKRDVADAESHWTKAVQLEPDNDKYRLSLASLQMRHGAPETRADGLEALENLSAKPDQRLVTLRTMLADAMARRDIPRIRELANTLASDPGASFADKLTRLGALRVMKDRAATSLLLELKESAASKPEDLAQLLIWMNAHDLALMVLEWLPDLPPDVISKPPVCVPVAEAHAKVLDWKKLREKLEGGSWAGLDYLRHAYLARALDRLEDSAAATAAWRQSLATAERRRDWLEALAKLAIAWGWEARAHEALVELTTGERCPRWVIEKLWTTAIQKRDTPHLRKLSRLRMNAEPANLAARNNFVCLSLLTRSTDGDPHELAAALYKEAPTNADVVTTYGLSLFQQGKIEEAVAVLGALEPEQQREPGASLYYGIFLTAAMQADAAKEFIDIGKKRPLLPEEQALLDRVTAAYKTATTPVPKPTPKPPEGSPNSPEPLKELSR